MGSLVRHSPSSRGTPPAPGHGDTGQCVEDTGVLAAVSGVTSLAGRTPDRAERLWVWRQTRPRGGSAGSCITTKVAAAGSAHHRIRPRGIPGPHRPDTTVVHRVIGGWDTCPSYPVPPQVSPGGTVEVRRGDGTLGTMRDPYAWGNAEPASEGDSFYGTFSSLGCWAPPCQGQEDFEGLLSLSWADQIDPSQSLSGAQGCGCGDRSGCEVAVQAHTSAVVVCPRGGPGPCAPSQRPCWSAQARYHSGP